MLKRSTPIRLLATALAALFVASSCGGGNGGGPIEVAMAEFSYTESDWTASAGEEITLVLNNTGTVIHNWSLVAIGEEITSEGDLPENQAERGGLYVFQAEVEPGQTATVTLTAPPAGTYQVICDIQAHFSAGMSGTLTVEG